jgi:hypothetical protein
MALGKIDELCLDLWIGLFFTNEINNWYIWPLFTGVVKTCNIQTTIYVMMHFE